MFITLPLTLFGLGFLLHFVFRAATYALPILCGIAAGFLADTFGATAPTALLIGVVACFLAIAIGRFAGLAMKGRATRGLLVTLHVIPAALAGGALAAALTSLAGIGGVAILAAPIAGLACGIAAAHRLVARTA